MVCNPSCNLFFLKKTINGYNPITKKKKNDDTSWFASDNASTNLVSNNKTIRSNIIDWAEGNASYLSWTGAQIGISAQCTTATWSTLQPPIQLELIKNLNQLIPLVERWFQTSRMCCHSNQRRVVSKECLCCMHYFITYDINLLDNKSKQTTTNKHMFLFSPLRTASWILACWHTSILIDTKYNTNEFYFEQWHVVCVNKRRSTHS